MFVKRGRSGDLIFILVKITDEILFSGSEGMIEEFITAIKKRFDVSKSIFDSTINCNGCKIQQDEKGNITMTMAEQMDQINIIPMAKSRRQQYNDKAKEAEYAIYTSPAGPVMWAGNGTLMQASFVGSYFQPNALYLKVHHIIEANKMVKEMKDLAPTMGLRKVSGNVKNIEIWNYSGDSFNISSGRDYRQTGLIMEMMEMMIESSNCESLFYIIDRESCKQKRVSHSSYGVGILACADADDRGLYLKKSLRSISPNDKIGHILHMDRKGLYDTITTLHLGEEYSLRQTVQRIRDLFEEGDIDVLRWITSDAEHRR